MSELNELTAQELTAALNNHAEQMQSMTNALRDFSARDFEDAANTMIQASRSMQEAAGTMMAASR